MAAIVQSIKFADGKLPTWMCPNGHMYMIGECGKPMEEAKCHCGATIGGKT